jgi:hypothetical protein
MTTAGCFIPFPYAFPTLSQTRPVFLNKAEDTVHAFRLDLKSGYGGVEFNPGNDCLWREIGRWPFDVIPPQVNFGLARGCLWHCIALDYSHHLQRTVLVRLYRPGFQTVELTFWNGAKPIEWRPANSISEQEAAIDELFAFEPGIVPWYDRPTKTVSNWKFGAIPAGSRSAGHKAALLFGADEFERLSRTPCEADAHQRLLEKSAWLRARANE